jgi:hypothetical protein
MIMSTLEWNCTQCGRLHRRALEEGSSGHVISTETRIDPDAAAATLLTSAVVFESGTVTYKLSTPVDLSCDQRDYSSMTRETIAEACEKLKEHGHTTECAEFWAAVLVMDKIGERWDHWSLPNCAACDKRRETKRRGRVTKGST